MVTVTRTAETKSSSGPNIPACGPTSDAETVFVVTPRSLQGTAETILRNNIRDSDSLPLPPPNLPVTSPQSRDLHSETHSTKHWNPLRVTDVDTLPLFL